MSGNRSQLQEWLLSIYEHPFPDIIGVLGRCRQEDQKLNVIFGFTEFQASLGYILKKRGEEEEERGRTGRGGEEEGEGRRKRRKGEEEGGRGRGGGAGRGEEEEKEEGEIRKRRGTERGGEVGRGGGGEPLSGSSGSGVVKG